MRALPWPLHLRRASIASDDGGLGCRGNEKREPETVLTGSVHAVGRAFYTRITVPFQALIWAEYVFVSRHGRSKPFVRRNAPL